ncbi:MAG: type II toxin-antitoxin system RelE/ParE family toxin [Timaviella obliquedivisa GSE-PSE-MK23-08B]|nr:type II toxin-antitoxin system RelE/ParE family toxin [Timaviella obliquedivisa GSE-PSE-MK23-08B]
MAGLPPFSIESTDSFQRSFKKLEKVYRRKFLGMVEGILEGMIEDPYPLSSRQEPLPSKIQLPDGWTFHKLEFRISKGASGQLRLMYLVNSSTYVIRLLWIYSHEQFSKRPPDKDLKDVIREILDC